MEILALNCGIYPPGRNILKYLNFEGFYDIDLKTGIPNFYLIQKTLKAIHPSIK